MHTQHKVTYTTIVKAPIAEVWNALTNAEMVRQYFFGANLETDWNVGSPIHFKGTYNGQDYEDKGVVQEYDAHKKLAYSYLSGWSGLPDQPENYLWVQYEVFPVSGGTELHITQSNYDEEKAGHCAENWKAVTDGLKKLVE